ncbi:HD domain-containing protein [Sinorhizobium meliloti]|uniref:HD domain-containing protein n=1 Tax=Rhizobium meliloti TaxID=382 RepID=UPI000FD6E073|nr:HD domain-containing protein [Sinorhizobium meliloti]MDW9409069.1 HD domain-containing protein [Sinorhizobium meliloti]MDW9454225.1 HD domain-containing protein [Sinorhizobium meliloti]MDW9466896.1 HD domain-containing protein [Sinorhizobium meliloti]MDW9518392.1 HD domain-containing protein [Sinorhizobium meliloti]MDW9555969.1 HD domain-containing protein [Sinorhizobium meliloti]
MAELLNKVIKDPIHGFIDFNGARENELKRLLSDPFFQRLRRVKQLGFSDYVFPSAAHSRFAHSLGVYKIAKRMLMIVEPEGLNGKWSPKAEACLAAALLHDVGHGMFSHAFEKAMEFYLARNAREDEPVESFEAAVDHEAVGRKIITDSSIGKALVDFGGPEFPGMVRNIIKKADENCIYTSIVSSQLDADRLDYAKRDAYFAGVSSGGIDLDWLLRNFKVGQNGDARFLYVDSKAYISLEQFTVTLFQLYPTIYLHKKTRGLEYMFAQLLSRVFELIASNEVRSTGLSERHPFVRFFREPGNLDHARLLDDTLFWGSLHQFRESTDASVSDIATRLSDRRILPMIDIWKVADEVLATRSGTKALTATSRVERIEAICRAVAKNLQEDSSVWSDSCYYDTYNRPIYKPMGVVGGHPQQINVSVGGQILDIASISPVVASAASFNIHRIYYDDRRVQNVDVLKRSIRDLIEVEFRNLGN